MKYVLILTLLILNSCANIKAQIRNYGQLCGSFRIYSAWQPVVNNEVSFVVYAYNGEYEPNDLVGLGIGFNELRIQYGRCWLYTWPVVILYDKLNPGGWKNVKVVNKIPSSVVGIRLYFQGLYPSTKGNRYNTLLSNGVELRIMK